MIIRRSTGNPALLKTMETVMRKWEKVGVLVGFGIIYTAFGLTFTPLEIGSTKSFVAHESAFLRTLALLFLFGGVAMLGIAANEAFHNGDDQRGTYLKRKQRRAS